MDFRFQIVDFRLEEAKALLPLPLGEGRGEGSSSSIENPKSKIENPFPLLALLLTLFSPPATAQDYPLLEEMNRQTQSLYRDVEAGIVRVQMPMPRWAREAAAKDDPLKKWDPILDPAVKQKIGEQRQKAMHGQGGRMSVTISSSTQPAANAPRDASSAIANWKVTQSGAGEVILEPRGEGGAASSIVIHAGGEIANGQIHIGGPLRLKTQPAGSTFAPNNIGLLLDDAGHVLVPIYIERDTIGAGVRIMIGDVEATATFVGSDEKTQLTILKLDKRVGRPVRMGAQRPAEGSLVMMLNPASGSGRLALWTGGEKDYGVVVGMDGSVAGLVRFGQFIGGPACRTVIDQLIRVGSIQRAILGARLTEVRGEDLVRRRNPQLADHPALLVDEIAPGSLAQLAGLKRGDFILELGNEPVGDLTTWAALSARGGETRLLVLRDAQRVELRINLQPQN